MKLKEKLLLDFISKMRGAIPGMDNESYYEAGLRQGYQAGFKKALELASNELEKYGGYDFGISQIGEEDAGQD